MSLRGKSLLDLSSVSQDDILSLFQLAKKIEQVGWSCVRVEGAEPGRVALVFLEPSTRTTMSFEVAAIRCGLSPFKLQSEGSSIQKGETLEDTLLTLEAMKFDLFVVRHGGREKLSEIEKKIRTPIINAGEGVSGHPTQALLDAYTIYKERGALKNERVVIIGDIVRSRVSASFVELLKKFEVEVAFCGPKEWLREISGVRIFNSLKPALEWATVVQALRIQKERFVNEEDPTSSEWDFIDQFQLNQTSLQALRGDGIILHPGPFNRGVEITEDVLKDPRSRIWNEVENGVYIRGALLARILGGR